MMYSLCHKATASVERLQILSVKKMQEVHRQSTNIHLRALILPIWNYSCASTQALPYSHLFHWTNHTKYK